MGRVAAPYGIKGWLKVVPMTSAHDTLLTHAQWWLRKRGGEWQEARLESGRPHGNTLVVQLSGVSDREAAAAFSGGEVGVPRSALPAPAPGEIYWADLVGLAVWNREGERLGEVAAVQEYGAHPVLRVVDGAGAARLIPLVAAYVDAVDVTGRRIDVDWQKDY
ncbi:MAG TPA: ribosome maturation factor RimM [Casimicrobiaceae bacterium]|nr:ribosome maturation factor RimM [Casimicrobiaceae bacterium]